MNLEAPKATVNKSQQEVFDFLSDVKNFESLMPESISKFEALDEGKFLFALKGMPEIVLKKKEVDEPSNIVLGAAGGSLDFALNIDIDEVSNNVSEVLLSFSGNFNTMMAMMIKKPITNFIQTLSDNLPEAV